jgi:hypothetical protein
MVYRFEVGPVQLVVSVPPVYVAPLGAAVANANGTELNVAPDNPLVFVILM